MEERKKWSRDEVTLALRLYYQLPSSRHDKTTKEVQELAAFLGRSVGAVVFKLGNLKSLDASDPGRGFTNGARIDREVWEHYVDKPGQLFEDARIIAERRLQDAGAASSEDRSYILDDGLEGLTRSFHEDDQLRIAKWRRGQEAFRLYLLRGYGESCCLSGMKQADFLVASHIVPWSVDAANRLNPRNGLLLNVFLDKAFDRGYMTIDASTFAVRVSSDIKDDMVKDALLSYDGQEIRLPRNSQRWPRRDFLEYHNDMVFRH